MSHAIEGRYPTGMLDLKPRPTPPAARSESHPAPQGLWKYQGLNRSGGIVALSVFVSVGLHAVALLGFNEKAPPPRPVQVDEGPLIQMAMPDVLEEEEKPVESLEDLEASEAPAIVVPMLVDTLTIVPVDAFVQPLDFTPQVTVDPNAVRMSAIPVNIARGSGGAEKLGKIFDISQLDRQPQAVFQPAPVFPADMKSSFDETQVTLEFIITNKGEVTMPRAIRSEHRRFEDAAASGVLKWKFKPGYRGGRPVNTRTQITITFRVDRS